jgi:exopolyphosphatase/guanosine-5'-triphosphate,3'-diphosphate pyrophosphatase
LAVILCRRRQDDTLPDYQTTIIKNTDDADIIDLSLPTAWLTQHPLIVDELLQENTHLAQMNLSLSIYCEV